jgi:phage FluMu protein Com
VNDRIIHYRHCGTDNQVAPDVVGKLCGNCGKLIYTPEVEAEIAAKPPTPSAKVDRSGDVLRVVCPHCKFTNEFPEFTSIDIFLCHDCGAPVAVEELIQ